MANVLKEKKKVLPEPEVIDETKLSKAEKGEKKKVKQKPKKE